MLVENALASLFVLIGRDELVGIFILLFSYQLGLFERGLLDLFLIVHCFGIFLFSSLAERTALVLLLLGRT